MADFAKLVHSNTDHVLGNNDRTGHREDCAILLLVVSRRPSKISRVRREAVHDRQHHSPSTSKKASWSAQVWPVKEV